MNARFQVFALSHDFGEMVHTRPVYNSGGAIHAAQYLTVQITKSSFTLNDATQMASCGGAVAVAGAATLQMRECVLRSNSAPMGADYSAFAHSFMRCVHTHNSGPPDRGPTVPRD